MALTREYFDLTYKYIIEYGPKTVLLMQVGAFFEVYGRIADDGITITGSPFTEYCEICELAKANSSPGYVKAGFRDYAIDKYLRKIQDAGYTAVVYTQDAPTQNTTRSLQGIYSPGTYFSAESNELSNNTSCVWIEKINTPAFRSSETNQRRIMIGMSTIDIYTGRTCMFEIHVEDFHNPTTYDELERFMSSYKPSEVIFITNLSVQELEDIIQFTGVVSKTIHKVMLSDDDDNKTTPSSDTATISTKIKAINKLNAKSGQAQGQSHIDTPSNVVKARRCSKQIYQREVLSTYYSGNKADTLMTSFSTYEYATQSLVFLLNFIYEHNPNLVSKIAEPIFENQSKRLILANHSLKQLNIIDDSTYTGKYSSVIRLLNNCRSPMGSRKCKYRILNPTFDAAVLESEYAITEHFIHKPDVWNKWRDVLSTLKDIERYHRQIYLKKIVPQSLYFLYNNLKTVRDLFTSTSSDPTLHKYMERFIQMDIISKCDLLVSTFEHILHIDMCRTIDDLSHTTNIICRGIYADLDAATDRYECSYEELIAIRKYLDDLLSTNGEKIPIKRTSVIAAVTPTGFSNADVSDYEFVKIHETDKQGFSLQATKKRAKAIEDRLLKEKGTIGNKVQLQYNRKMNGDSNVETHTFDFIITDLSYHTATGTNNTITSTQINRICDTIVRAKNEMCDLISLAYNKFVASLCEFNRDFENIVEFISIIDNLQNQCYVASKYNYCRPIIQSDKSKSFVTATGIRHCLIERLNTDEIYVVNDISLGLGTTCDDQFHTDGMLLYGTNAVGKTSLIRALGIAIIMAQSGFYVPCSHFVYKPYETLFTRILGNDNLFKGLSTFVVEMSELRVILKMANKNSIILGDELCSGTEIDSAISIFVAGLSKLHEVGASFVFATHLHEIKNYSEITSLGRLCMKHLRVTYNRETDTLIYDRKLNDGPGTSMYGLEVCKSLHLPADFLENANQIRMKYRCGEDTSSSILTSSTSRYNAKKIRRMCELCNERLATEIHHLQHQKDADANNFIGHVHKNHAANLASICEECHNAIHHPGVGGGGDSSISSPTVVKHRRVKTSKGSAIISIGE